MVQILMTLATQQYLYLNANAILTIYLMLRMSGKVFSLYWMIVLLNYCCVVSLLCAITNLAVYTVVTQLLLL